MLENINRKKLFIIISIAVGMVIVGILFYLFLSDDLTNESKLEEVIVPDIGQEIIIDEFGNEILVDTEPEIILPEYNVDDNYTKQLARIFVERFESFSNQNDNTHIDDVLELVTPSMARWVKTQYQTMSNDYSGMSTQVVASRLDSLVGNSAIVSIEAQQVVEVQNTKETIQKSGKVELEKVGGEWKVDGFFWD